MSFFDSVPESWQPILAQRHQLLSEIEHQLEMVGGEYQPIGQNIFKAFEVPFDEVRVLIVGQDPYPTLGMATGLAFSVPEGTASLPRSLLNIFTELTADLQIAHPSSGDLTPWVESGVLLLNRALTVEVGKTGSHRNLGWHEFTGFVIEQLVARGAPLVAVLWGRDAQLAKQWLGETPFVESAHPSPLSARKGFFGSRPFSKVNTLLREQGAEPIDWRLT